jgi:O-antigen ligase
MRISERTPIEPTQKASQGKQKPSPWRTRLLSRGAPLLLALGLGLLVALLIASGAPLYAIALVILPPAIILFNAWPFAAAIIWMLVVPFISVSGDPERANWVIHRLLMSVGLGMAVLSYLFKTKKHSPIRLGPAELSMGIYVSLVVVSILASPEDSLQNLFRKFGDRILVPFCMYLLMRFSAPRQRDHLLLLAAALFMGISQSIIGLLSWFMPEVLPSQWLAFYGEARTTGSLFDGSLYSSVLMFCVVLLFQAAMTRKAGLFRPVLLGACGLCSLCAFLSFERGAWLGMAFVFIGLWSLFPKPMLWMTIILLIIAVFLGTTVLSRQMAWASSRMEDKGTVYDRIIIYDAMFQMIQQRPLFGWGYENLDHHASKFYRRVGDAPLRDYITSHNTYLTILTELGFIGFPFYLFPIIWWAAFAIRALPQMPKDGLWSRTLLVALCLAALDHITVSNFMDMRYFPTGLTLFWMIIGLIANMVSPYTISLSERNL